MQGRAEDVPSQPRFSGVYNPTCTNGLEVFSGAWLMHSTRFTKDQTHAAMRRISFVEAHTLLVAMGDGKRPPTDETCEDMTKHMVLTRDYFGMDSVFVFALMLL